MNPGGTHRRLALVAASVIAFAVSVAPATAAPRPPLPAGGQQVAPGHLPGQCTGPGDNAYGPNYGYYYSNASKAWISAPRCVPRWGNLALMPSQVVRAGGKVTMTAVPDQGSNSAQYAPQTKSISWSFPGKRVAGCGNADLSCTVVPFAKAAKEWQWGLFHVTMPRTFFINSRGSNCAGIEICAGFATNAWSFAGVPPKGKEPPVRITGKVEAIKCAECNLVEPLPGVRVTAKGDGGGSATTAADGSYSITVDGGRYTVEPQRKGTDFVPPSREVNAKNNVSGVDFRACADDAAGASAAIFTRSLPIARGARGGAVAADEQAVAKAARLCPPEEIDWLMEKRFTAKSVSRWDDDGFPSGEEVNPRSWTATLYTRASKKKFVCDANTRFVWTVQPAARLVGGRLPKVGCKTQLHVTRLGKYAVKAQMQRRKAGSLVWRDAGKPVRGNVEMKDLLIAGIGDSNGSGEGNAPFYYNRCNRSIASYQLQTALAVELKDPHSSVTFIHTACSGASTDHLFSSTYAGTRGGSPPLEPQIRQVQRLLAQRGSAPKRDVDVALVSIGVNDLAFGPTMEFCIKIGLTTTLDPPCHLRPVKATRHKDGKRTGKYTETPGESTLADKLAGLQDALEGRYGGIAAALPKLGVRRDHVFLAQYPNFSYGDDGKACGIELGSVVHFLPSTWEWMSAVGGVLNQHVRGAAAAAGRSWAVPDYDFGAFLNRGYCSTNSLFRSVGGALGAGDMGGPFHPTAEGHLIEAAGTIPAVCRKLFDGDATCNEPKPGAG
jgi:hypothetical protein